jgi:hypothetical protein
VTFALVMSDGLNLRSFQNLSRRADSDSRVAAASEAEAARAVAAEQRLRLLEVQVLGRIDSPRESVR